MSRTRAGTVPISLHRLLADWGEGASDAPGGEGAGGQTQPGDATWAHRFFDTVDWTTGGGDFEALPSAALSVGGLGSYAWSSPALVADVQQWLDDPASNFGWIITGEEGSSGTAKRFDSKDNPDELVRPMLTIQYGAGVTFVVNDIADGNDASPGDGLCETMAGNERCPLRAAIEEANALPGLDAVVLPAGTHTLTLAGGGEDDAATGDLDINDFMNLIGDGADRSIVDGGALADRVFHVLGSHAVQISGVGVRGGDVTATRAENDGGGILNLGDLSVIDCAVTGNSAVSGGGIFNDGGTLRLAGSTVSGNTAGIDGGGLYNQGSGMMTLTNSTISGNTGDGIYNAGASSTAELSNTLLAGNAAGSCGGDTSTIGSLGYNLDDGDDCGLTSVGDLIDTDPLLGPLQNNGGGTQTHELLDGSPAIDAANPGTPGSGGGVCEAADQRGIARPQGAACDIGAFEAEAPANLPPQADAGDDSTAECSSPQSGVLTLDGSGSSDPDSSPDTNDDIVLFEWFLDYDGAEPTLLGTGEMLEVTLPLGSHVVTLRVTDSFDETDTDVVAKTVEDTVPPEISVSVSPTVLWPPNHRMVRIEALVEASDACSEPTVRLESITSNESDGPAAGQGGGPKQVSGAEPGMADFEFQLRAERNGNGNGRVYTIVYSATDGSFLTSDDSAQVLVPHDMGRGRASSRNDAPGRAGRGHRLQEPE
jgi:hypothetical protein